MLRKLLPGFEVPNDPEEGVYSNAGLFATKLREGIVDRTLSEQQTDRIFSALNNVGTSDDIDIQNQLAVGILEILLDEPASILTARQKLEGRSLEIFEEMKTFWGVPEPEDFKN